METLKSFKQKRGMFRAPSKSHWQLAEQKLNLRGQDGRQTGDYKTTVTKHRPLIVGRGDEHRFEKYLGSR